jgi:hypothetical protein
MRINIMPGIYYIYQSSNRDAHQAYIGKSITNPLYRICEHVSAAFSTKNAKGKLVDSKSGHTSNPAEWIQQVGISNCIYGYFLLQDNYYGIGQQTVDEFIKAG